MNCKFLSSVGSTMLVIGLVLVMVCRFTGSLGGAALAFLLIFASFGVIYLADRVRRQENEKAPISEVNAAVVGHRKETYRNRYSNSAIFYIIFKPDDGSEKLEFKVPEWDYHHFDTGHQGPLRYRAGEYLSFCAKDMSAVKPISPLPDEYDTEAKEPESDTGSKQSEKRLYMLKGKADSVIQKLKSTFSKPDKKPREAVEKRKDILTHELDE